MTIYKDGQNRPGLLLGTAGCALIDEIDKADTDFQDDMLDVLDQMQFDIIETDRTVSAIHRPVIIITSNAKKIYPIPFSAGVIFTTLPFRTPK